MIEGLAARHRKLKPVKPFRTQTRCQDGASHHLRVGQSCKYVCKAKLTSGLGSALLQENVWRVALSVSSCKLLGEQQSHTVLFTLTLWRPYSLPCFAGSSLSECFAADGTSTFCVGSNVSYSGSALTEVAAYLVCSDKHAGGGGLN